MRACTKAAAARQGHAAARPLLEALTAMAPQRLSVHHVHVFDGAGTLGGLLALG